MTLSRRIGLVVTIVVCSLAARVQPASALSIRLDPGNDGLDIFTIADNDSSDTNSDLGHILFSGDVSGFSVSFYAYSNASPSYPEPPELELSDLSVSGPAGGGLIGIQISDANFFFGGAPTSQAFLTAQVVGALSGAGTFTAFQNVGVTNTEFAPGISTVISGPFTGPGGFSSSQFTGFFYTPGSGFAMTQIVTISGNFGTATADVTSTVSTAVPEPVSLVLLGSGLAALTAGRWRRRKRDV